MSSDQPRTHITRVVPGPGGDVRVLQICNIEVRPPTGAPSLARADRLVFRIGSHASNDLVLDDPTVSKSHLELCALPDGYRLIDLSSSNGSFLGSARLGEVRFFEPISIRAGDTMLKFSPASDEGQLEAAEETRFGLVIGRSVVMRELFAQLQRVAPSDCALLLEGETGVGKELIAESVHRASARADGPFVVVDCAAVAPELVESELFGHVRGAFTDAEEDRHGLLAMADGGTLFLDEIGELPLRLQVKLLGVLDRGAVTPVGGTQSRAVNLRVVAATNRDLAREVNEGRFRADLFYRLAVARLRVPPLRDRLDDLPLLVNAALERLRARGNEGVPNELPAIAVARLAGQAWPGNVRELFNAVERAMVALDSEPMVRPPAAHLEPYQAARDRFLDEFQRSFLIEALKRANGQVTAAARAAGVEQRYFRRLVARHGLATIDHRRR